VIACAAVAIEIPDPTKTLEELRRVKAQLEALLTAHPVSVQSDRVVLQLDAAIGGVDVAILALESLALRGSLG
jgi:hypothetical protein